MALVVKNLLRRLRRLRRCKKRGFNPFPWGRAWQPSLVFLPGEFYGQRSLVDYSQEDHKELDTTEVT